MKKIGRENKTILGLIIFILLMVGGFFALQLVQKNQENRSQAGSLDSTMRSTCKGICSVNLVAIVTGKTQACNDLCNKLTFSCAKLTTIDQVRNSICYGECKIAMTAKGIVDQKNYDKNCVSFCNGVTGLVSSNLGCKAGTCGSVSGTTISSPNNLPNLCGGNIGPVNWSDGTASDGTYNWTCGTIPSSPCVAYKKAVSTAKPIGSVCDANGDCSSSSCVGGRCISTYSACNPYGGSTGCASGAKCERQIISNQEAYRCVNLPAASAINCAASGEENCGPAFGGGNYSRCESLGGWCTDFPTVPRNGSTCAVSDKNLRGKVRNGYCGNLGDSTVKCCAIR